MKQPSHTPGSTNKTLAPTRQRGTLASRLAWLGCVTWLWLLVLTHCGSPVTGPGLVFCNASKDCPQGQECSMNACIKTPDFRSQSDGVIPADKAGEISRPETSDAADSPDAPDSRDTSDTGDASDGTELQDGPDLQDAPDISDAPDASDGEPQSEPQLEPSPEPQPDETLPPDTLDGSDGPDATPEVEPSTPDEPLTDNTADMPPDGGSSEQPTEPSTPLRVSTDLIALYRFNKGSGSKVFDVSGFGNKLDLTISGNSNRYNWLNGGGLEITNEIRIANSNPAKIYTEITRTKLFTVEIWCKPANTSQSGPARMVSLSKDQNFRNFTLGQDKDGIELRLRTSNGSGKTNGEPHEDIFSIVTTAISHFIVTYDGTNMSLYKNGQFQKSFPRSIRFSDWDKGYPLIIANEIKDSRDWRGEIYLVAIYRRALNATEVLQNYQAGHR